MRKKARAQKANKVIRVAFGPGGGRITADRADALQPNVTDARPSREPVMGVFTGTEAARLLGLTTGKLRSLDRAGIVRPTGRRRGHRAYTFPDIIALRTARDLLNKAVRIRDVARAVASLRLELPGAPQPLSRMRICSDGRRVVVRSPEGSYEPSSGQMVMDFEVSELRDAVIRVLRPFVSKQRARLAYELYLKANQLDENPATMDEAERLYKKALEYDPWLGIALTNLGNIAFRRSDEVQAEVHYRKALELDASQPEAQYNLGYLLLERGEAESALELFRGAIAADPQFADAYFNLAMAYEQLGLAQKARPAWNRYLELEPNGTWAEIARRHI